MDVNPKDISSKDVSPKKRFVGLIHCLDMGGAEKMIVRILNYCVREDFEVHLIIFDKRGELLEELSFQVILHDLNKASISKGMPKCLKTLRTLKADIVFSGIGFLNIALAPFIPVMRRLNPKTKWIARETNIVSLQNKTAKYPKLFDGLYRHTYKNYDVIVAQSEDMEKDLLENYFKTDKIVLINNPIDHDKIIHLASEEPTHPFDTTKINLLSVARLREEKRHDLMLKTLTYLPENYHLTIVGSGEKEEMLKALTQKLALEKQVTFVGNQSNPYSYMKRADLFMLTSEREGFPNVLLEANCTGLPIVAFASLGGIQEIINEGENGFTVPFSDCEALAQCIKELSSTAFDRDKIHQNTIQKYSQNTILKKYKNIFLK